VSDKVTANASDLTMEAIQEFKRKNQKKCNCPIHQHRTITEYTNKICSRCGGAL
jgi:hypothetical protein